MIGYEQAKSELLLGNFGCGSRIMYVPPCPPSLLYAIVFPAFVALELLLTRRKAYGQHCPMAFFCDGERHQSTNSFRGGVPADVRGIAA